MGPSRAFSLPSGYAALAFLIAGTACLITAVVFLVFSRDVFDSANFGRRAAQSLSDPGVSRYAATLVADRIIHRKPDLIAFRPMIVPASETVVSSRAFRLIVEQAAVRAHRLALSEGANRVILSLPDLNILIHDAVTSANPALAAKIPKSLDSTVARMANGRLATAGLRLARAGKAVRWLWAPLFVLSIVLYVLAHLLAPDRRRAMAVAGAALVFAGLLLVGMVAANPIAAAWIHDPIQLGLVRGLWRAYLGDLARLGIIVAGIGLTILFKANGKTLLSSIALAATLYHALNHAFFKSLLFLATGSVLHATHERSLGKLGGLIHRMPWVAWSALIGALAIAAYRGSLPYGRLFAAAVLVTPFVLVAFSASRSLAVSVALMVAMGIAESGFAAMQTTLALLSAPAHARGGAMGILSACIGTQPLGTLAIGALAGTLGAPRAFALNAIVALAVIAPVAIPLARARGEMRR